MAKAIGPPKAIAVDCRHRMNTSKESVFLPLSLWTDWIDSWRTKTTTSSSSVCHANRGRGTHFDRGRGRKQTPIIPTRPSVPPSILTTTSDIRSRVLLDPYNPYIRNLIREGRWKWSRWDLVPSQNGREVQHKAWNKQNLSYEISDIGVRYMTIVSKRSQVDTCGLQNACGLGYSSYAQIMTR